MKILILLALATVCAARCPYLEKIQGRDVCTLEGLLEVGADTTISGCKCVSKCGATIDDRFNCDWCYTDGECGNVGLTGKFWDYCKFNEAGDFEKQSADLKMLYLWKKVNEDPQSSTYPLPTSVFSESVQTTFDNQLDVLPPGRIKAIHSVGAVCQFKFQASSHSNYTGLFEANAQSFGLIRLGSAQPVTSHAGMVPGMGIKFLRSNVRSGNVLALADTPGDFPPTLWNFFGQPLANRVSPLSGIKQGTLKIKSSQATKCTNMVGLSDLAKFKVDGTPVKKPNFPFLLRFESAGLQFPEEVIDHAGLQDQLTSIPPGTPLFNVFAVDSPGSFNFGSNGSLLGTIVSSSECVNSYFGDTQLTFHHGRIEDDIFLKPEWTDQLHPEDCGASGPLDAEPPKTCPSYIGTWH